MSTSPLALAAATSSIWFLSACGSSVTPDDGGAGGASGSTSTSSGAQAGSAGSSTGGAPPTGISCDDLCATAPLGGCSNSEVPAVPCELQCERVLAAPERCDTETDVFLTCILDKGACSSAAYLCLEELKAWTECSGVFCGACTGLGQTGWSGTSCACLGVPERSSSCSESADVCDCTLWEEPWLETTPSGACDWPYEV